MHRYRVVGTWSRAEWEQLPVENRPPGAIPFGDGWVLLEEWPLSSPTEAGAGASGPAGPPGERLAPTPPWPPDPAGGGMPGNGGEAVARCTIVVPNPEGLHLRAASLFAHQAGRFASRIRVDLDGRRADAKSILDLATLAAERGDLLRVEARGPDAEAALEALAALVMGRFHEVGAAD